MKKGIRQVAALASVSSTTVSEIFSGVGRYAPATVERVKAAALQLDYRPSRRARAMQAGVNHCVTIVSQSPVHEDAPYQAMILTGVALEARRFGYSVELVQTPGESEWGGILRDTDGVIASGHISQRGFLDRVRLAGKPLTQVNPGVCGPTDCVGPDDIGGASVIGKLIREHGYERVVYVGGRSGVHASVSIRAKAIGDAVNGLELHYIPVTPDTVDEMLSRFCSDGRGRTVFVGYGDQRLLQFLVTGARRGLECPRDYGLASCHMRDDQIFGMLGVDLCGAKHSLQQMGQEAGKMMMRKLHDANAPQPTVLISEEIHVGGSLRKAE